MYEIKIEQFLLEHGRPLYRLEDNKKDMVILVYPKSVFKFEWSGIRIIRGSYWHMSGPTTSLFSGILFYIERNDYTKCWCPESGWLKRT